MMHVLGLGLAAARAAPAWSPLSPLENGASVVAWWDPSRGLSEAGGLVAAHADRIGGASVSQATETLKPVLDPVGLNGSGASLVYDGADDYLALSPAPAAVPTGAAPGWMFAVAQQSTPGSDGATRVLTAYGANTAGTRRSLHRVQSGAVSRVQFGDAVAASTETSVDFFGICAVLGLYDGTTFRVRINGVDGPAAAASTNTANSRLRIGSTAVSAAGSIWSGAVGHVIYGAGVLSPADVQRLEAWGLWACGQQARLPANHPYRSARP